MSINEALRIYIKKRGFKQAAVAEAVGMKMQAFNAVLKGHVRLSAEVFMKACDFMKASPNDVFELQ